MTLPDPRCFLLLALMACGAPVKDSPPAPLPDRSPPPIPVLSLVGDVPPPLDAYPIPFALGPGPSLLMRTRDGTDHALILDTPGDTTIYLSRTGDGPGELRDAALLVVEGDTLFAYDMGNQRIARWTETGQTLGETRIQELALMSMPGRAGEWLGMRLGRNGPLPVSISMADGGVTPLVSTADTFWMSHAMAPSREEAPLLSVGVWDGGFLMADGREYLIGGYDWEGNLRFVIAPDLEPNLPDEARLDAVMAKWRRSGRPGGLSESAQRDRFRTTPEQWFSHLAPPRLDSKGRLWIVGQQSGRVFADVWWRDALLGRTWLDCRGADSRWQLAEDRIALICLPDPDDSVHDVIYRLWRIEEGKP